MLSCVVNSVQELLLTFKEVSIVPASACLYPSSPRGNLGLQEVGAVGKVTLRTNLLTWCTPRPKPTADNPCPTCVFGLGGYRVAGSVSEGDATEQFHVSHRVPSVRGDSLCESLRHSPLATLQGRRISEKKKRKPTKTRRPLTLL